MKTFGDLPRDVVRARTLTSPATLLRLVVVAAEFVITSRIKLVPEKRKRRSERRAGRTRIRRVTRPANRMKRLYSCVPRRRRVKKDSRSRTSHGHKVNPIVERGVKRGERATRAESLCGEGYERTGERKRQGETETEREGESEAAVGGRDGREGPTTSIMHKREIGPHYRHAAASRLISRHSFCANASRCKC